MMCVYTLLEVINPHKNRHLNPWNKVHVLLGRVKIAQLVALPAFYGGPKFISWFTKARNAFLPWRL
jgi:hypothetical protein